MLPSRSIPAEAIILSYPQNTRLPRGLRLALQLAATMFVDVPIGVPDPGAVDTAAVAKELPYGTVTVTAVKGGLEIPAEQGSDAIIIANAAVVVSLDDGKAG